MDIHHTEEISNPSDVATSLIQAIALEHSIDVELEDVLAANANIENTIRSLHSKTALAINSARSQASDLLSSTSVVANLADHVSKKVRELDAARSRVRSTLEYIDILRGRGRAMEGARASMDKGDIESAARCMAIFLDVDEEVARKMEATRIGNAPSLDASKNSRDLMRYDFLLEDINLQNQEMNDLRGRIVAAIRDAAAKAVVEKSHAEVAKSAAMLGSLRLKEEGSRTLTEYLKGLIAERAQNDYNALVDMFADSGTFIKSGYVDALTNLFRDVAAAIEEHLELLKDSFGPDNALVAVLNLHAECDIRGARILQRFVDHRGLPRLISQTGMRMRNDSSTDSLPIEPRQVEGYLSELLTICTRGEEYLHFVLARMGEARAPSALSPSHETSLRSGQLATSLRELLSYYISLEEYYVEGGVLKAIRIDEPVVGSLTSSIVDDAFFVLLSAGRRALATRRAPSAVSVLNQVHTSLSTTLRSALSRGLQGAAGRLAAVAPKDDKDSSSSTTNEAARRYALAYNNIDTAASYVEKLKHQLDEMVAPLFPAPHDRDRLKLVLADLGKAAADFRRLSAQGAEQLCAALFAPIRSLLDDFLERDYVLQEDDVDSLSSWPQLLVNEFLKQYLWLQPVLTLAVFEGVVLTAIDKITSRMEAAISQKRFTQLGGLQLERDVRALLLGFSEVTSRTIRDRFARLQQTATILGVESAEEAMELASSGAGAWRLGSLEVRQALSQRVDL